MTPGYMKRLRELAVEPCLPLVMDRQVIEAAIAALDALTRERDEALVVIRAFMEKWPEVERNVNSFIGLAHARSGGKVQYRGPSLTDELAIMKRLAESPIPPTEGGHS